MRNCQTLLANAGSRYDVRFTSPRQQACSVVSTLAEVAVRMQEAKVTVDGAESTLEGEQVQPGRDFRDLQPGRHSAQPHPRTQNIRLRSPVS